MTIIYEDPFTIGTHSFIVELHTNPCATVELVTGTVFSLQTIAKLVRGYKGIYSNDLASEQEMYNAVKDLNATKLQTPFEMISFVFLITNVTRAFTHQLVRTRIGASYVQESMRFLGAKDIYRALVGTEIHTVNERLLDYRMSINSAILSYERLLASGVSSEEARGVLPTNILTSIFFGVTLRTLQHIYAQRMCCQAQPGEWQVVMKQIKDLLIENYNFNFLSAPFERGEPCGYRASFDRKCIWQKDN